VRGSVLLPGWNEESSLFTQKVWVLVARSKV
jgi:hypothetical protein